MTNQGAVAIKSTVHVRRIGGADKAVRLPAEETEIIMGANGGVAEFLGVADQEQRASTLDYVVAATAACLTGAFARALAARSIALPVDAHAVEAVADISEEEKVLLIKRIHVIHRVRLPEEDHDEARRVHGFYHRGCHVSRSLETAIDITSHLELV